MRRLRYTDRAAHAARTMSRAVRSILFLLFVAVFLAVGPLIVLWSQGYRFDREARRITKVGAIFLKTDPSKATITVREIDHEWKRERSVGPALIYTGVLFKDLLPKSYEVTVSSGKDYVSWKKEIVVEPLGVAKATHVVLFPKEIPGTSLPTATGIQALWPDPERNASYLVKKGTSTLFHLNLKDPAAQPEPLFNLRAFAGGSAVEHALSSAFGKNVIFRLDSGDAILWFPEKTPKAKLASRYLNRLLEEAGVRTSSLDYVWHPTDPDRFFVIPQEGSQGFYRVNILLDEFQRVTRDRLRAFGTGRTNSYFLTISGDLFRLDQDGEPSFVNSFKEGDLPQSGFFEIVEAADGVFILSRPKTGALWLLEKEFVIKISEKSDLVSLSPDAIKLAILDGKELWLLFLSRQSDDVVVEKRTKILLREFGEKPQELFWLSDNWHLLAVFDSEIELLETDFRQPLNTWRWELGNLSQPFFQQKQNTLWALKEKNLLRWQIK